MCCTLALSFRGVQLAAADTRWTFSLGDERWSGDYGGKIRRLDRGWAVATGNARWGARGLRLLEERGVDDIRATLAEALAEAREFGPVDGLSHFFVVRDDGGLEIVSNQPGQTQRLPLAPTKLRLWPSWPPRISEEAEQAVQAAFVDRLITAQDLTGIINAVACAFREARSHDDGSMSSEIEVGFSTLVDHRAGYLKARAADIVPGRDLRFSRPPVTPPETPAERILFTAITQ